MEGLGRQLYPQLDLWATAKPFLETWMMNQGGAQAVINAVKERAHSGLKKLPELPELLYDSLRQGKTMNTEWIKLYQGYRDSKRQPKQLESFVWRWSSFSRMLRNISFKPLWAAIRGNMASLVSHFGC